MTIYLSKYEKMIFIPKDGNIIVYKYFNGNGWMFFHYLIGNEIDLKMVYEVELPRKFKLKDIYTNEEIEEMIPVEFYL